MLPPWLILSNFGDGVLTELVINRRVRWQCNLDCQEGEHLEDSTNSSIQLTKETQKNALRIENLLGPESKGGGILIVKEEC